MSPLEMDVDCLWLFGKQPLTIHFGALLHGVLCPPDNDTAPASEKATLTIHCICKPDWKTLNQWKLASDVARGLVVLSQPYPPLFIQLLDGQIPVLSEQRDILCKRPL